MTACDKTRYPSRAKARAALEAILTRSHREGATRRPTHVYACHPLPGLAPDLTPRMREPAMTAEDRSRRQRPAQTEPTEAQIEVIADSIESFSEEHVHTARRLYPDVWKRDLALVVLKAAFTAGQEDKP